MEAEIIKGVSQIYTRQLEQQIGGFSRPRAGYGEVKPDLGCHHGGWDGRESQALQQKSLLASLELACLFL